MVLSRIFPPGGGGAARRWFRLKKDLYRRSGLGAFDRLVEPPLSLFDFTQHDDAADAAAASGCLSGGGWRLSDDEVIGGYSRGNMWFIQNEGDYGRHMGFDFADQMANSEGASDAVQKGRGNMTTIGDTIPPADLPFTPFLRWEGTIDTTVGIKSRAFRSGFAAIRCPEFPGWNGLSLKNHFNALEILCRTDGRAYTVNLKVSSFFPDELYQGTISVEPTCPPGSDFCKRTGGNFATLIMPLEGFILTRNGREVEVQRRLDGAFTLEHLGITLMDGKDGAFQFDIARIRAVNFINGHVMDAREQQKAVLSHLGNPLRKL